MNDRSDIAEPDWVASLGRALRRVPTHAEEPSFFLEDRQDLVVRRTGSDPPLVTRSRRTGLALRTADRLAYLSDPSPEDADGLAAGAQHAARSVRPPNLTLDREGPVEGRLADHPWLESLDEILREVQRVCPGAVASARAVGFEQQVLLVERDRAPVPDRRRGSRVRLECRLRRKTGESSSVGEVALTGDAVRDEPRLRELAREVAERSEQRLSIPDYPAGDLPVVLAPGLGGILVHELVGHALEADTVLDGDSWLAGRDGSGLCRGPKGLSVIDDPRRGRASWRADDEGELSRAIPLIRGGVVAGLLHDRRSARETGLPPTGHGRCSSFREPVRPRMGCTFVAPGPFEPREVIEGLRDAVYVRRMEAGTVDTRTGRASFRITDADRIRDGRIEAPMKPHVLVVEGRSMLPAIERVAGDLVFDRCIGGCHRDGQPLAISVGAPTICIGVATVLV